jgi:glycerophosphoryl diester phosphodiesterase
MTSINTSIRGYSNMPPGTWGTASTPLPGGYPPSTTAPHTATGGKTLALALEGKKKDAAAKDTKAEDTLKKVTDNVNPRPRTDSQTPIGRERIQAAKKAAEEAERKKGNARNPNFAASIQLSNKGYVRVKALNNGTVFMEVPKQIYPPAPARRIILPGITPKSDVAQISQAVERIAKAGALPYVYTVDNRPIYNRGPGGVKFADPAKLDRAIWAHAGSIEDKPWGFELLAWQNKINYAFKFAYEKKFSDGRRVDVVETDVHLNLKSGKVVFSHDPTAIPIDSNGKRIGPNVNVIHGEPSEVFAAVDTVSAGLTVYNRVAFPNTTFAIEMKKDTGLGFGMTKGYAAKLARALYDELKMHDRREDVIITSMEPEMLAEMHKLAKADGIKMNFTLVLGLAGVLNKQTVDDTKRNMPYVKFIAFASDGPPNLFPGYQVPNDPYPSPPRRSKTTKADVDYAKAQGFKVVSWNWDPSWKSDACDASNTNASIYGVNAHISDCPTKTNNSDWRKRSK